MTIYRPSDKPRRELAQRLAHTAPAPVIAAVLTVTGGAAVAKHNQVAAHDSGMYADVSLMTSGTATQILAEPIHRQGYGAGPSGVMLNLSPAHGQSSATLDLSVGDAS